MSDKPGCGCIRCYERQADELRAEIERLRAALTEIMQASEEHQLTHLIASEALRED
jgi:prefoldin subunit 5